MNKDEMIEILKNQIGQIEKVQEGVIDHILLGDERDIYTENCLRVINSAANTIQSLVLAIDKLEKEETVTNGN